MTRSQEYGQVHHCARVRELHGQSHSIVPIAGQLPMQHVVCAQRTDKNEQKLFQRRDYQILAALGFESQLLDFCVFLNQTLLLRFQRVVSLGGDKNFSLPNHRLHRRRVLI